MLYCTRVCERPPEVMDTSFGGMITLIPVWGFLICLPGTPWWDKTLWKWTCCILILGNGRKLEKCYQVHGMGSDPRGRIFDRVDLLRQVNLHSSILDRKDHPSSSFELLIFTKVVDEVEHHALHGITCSQRVWQVIRVCICASVTQWENFTVKRLNSGFWDRIFGVYPSRFF